MTIALNNNLFQNDLLTLFYAIAVGKEYPATSKEPATTQVMMMGYCCDSRRTAIVSDTHGGCRHKCLD
jgi:hypothetical protein